MKIDMNKKYTSNSNPVRILCTDRKFILPVVGLFENGDIHYFSTNGISPSLDTKFNLKEVWEPIVNEWCLFCNDKKPHRTILDQFNEMTDDGKFQSVCGTIWNYCYKFDGTLPEYLKNINGEIKC